MKLRCETLDAFFFEHMVMVMVVVVVSGDGEQKTPH
jgi:hypothetical protein